MAPKVAIPKAPKRTDKIITGLILDVQGFLAHFNNSEDAKKIVKAFTNSGILNFLSFNYTSVNKDAILEFYLKAKIAEGRKIISKVAGKRRGD